ncbi:MAG: ABC transporter substrate-binding protein [Nitrospirales bacterium]|nr:ABC transporter substrate-binding protein [Nitrospirales bacterium]
MAGDPAFPFPGSARSSGLDNGEMQWRLFGTGPAIVNAFEKGELDIAYIGLPPAIIGIERGVGIRCVAGGHVEGTVICGKRADKCFPGTEDLGELLGQYSGKSIGVPGKGSIHDVILTDSLEKYGLTEEIGVVNFPWADRVVEAMAKGDVAAAVGTPALAVTLRMYVEGKILYPPSRLWPHNPSYGILVSISFLERHRGLVRAFLTAHEEATAFMRACPEKAAEIIARFVGFVGADFVLEMLRVSPKYCAQLTGEYLSSTMEFAATLQRLGYIDRVPPEDRIFDTSLIRELHPPGHHYGDGIAGG